ncbi:NADH-quinone oxidoreductase subunit L [soil metagenome]
MNFSLSIWILILPLATFLITGLFGKSMPKKISGILGTISIGIAAVIAVNIAYNYFFFSGKTGEVFTTITALKYSWLSFSPTLSIDMGIILDPISVMMLVVVTFVSLMVHLYSYSYMKDEPRYHIFFSFLSLFSFSMLGLVVASNIFQMYIFWELVGVSSFLLIGFYYDKPSAVAASKKAFIVTRFADLGFLIGILLLSFYSESLDFQTIISRLSTADSPFLATATAASFLGASAMTWALCLIFIGGAGKSAMFPLHIWLPDAMEGPTPVSALIHAATMVVAGVFLVARLFPLYNLIPTAHHLVMYVGAFSALFAAVIACTQTDIKRILAFSTMSQIGYMMFALGVSGYGGEDGLGYTASMFHLFTHAMFKALLFLAAGAVIHHVHNNDLSAMGGMRKQMPVTNILFLLACLAISGIPPLSGFFSKEEILTAAFDHNKLIYGVGILTAALTAFYMFRLYYSIFWNKPQEHHADSHHKEAEPGMLIALCILGIGTVAAGFIPFTHYITSDGQIFDSEFHLNLALIAVAAGVTGIIVATMFYLKPGTRAEKISTAFGGFYRAAYKKFYVDEVYTFITKRIIFNFIAAPAAWIDKNIVDRTMILTGDITSMVSDEIKSMQSGKVNDYVVYFFLGIIALSALAVFY